MTYQYNPNNQTHTITKLRIEIVQLKKTIESLKYVVSLRDSEITRLERNYRNALTTNARLTNELKTAKARHAKLQKQHLKALAEKHE